MLNKQGIYICKFLIGNQFHVTLRIVGPWICKQCLNANRWNVESRAEKANKLKSEVNISQHQLRQLKIWNYVFLK